MVLEETTRLLAWQFGNAEDEIVRNRADELEEISGQLEEMRERCTFNFAGWVED